MKNIPDAIKRLIPDSLFVAIIKILIPGSLFVPLMFGGCASHVQPEGDLLDNKVSAERVQTALQKAGHQFKHVKAVGTSSGVTLSGTVNSDDAKKRAEEIAESTHRSMKLTNELQVEQ